MSLRDTILEADDRRSEIVDIPEWGVKVLVKSMSAKQRGQMVEMVKDKSMVAVDICLALVLDPDTGDRVFDPADRDALASKNGDIIDRLAQQVLRISGVDVGAAQEEIEADPT